MMVTSHTLWPFRRGCALEFECNGLYLCILGDLEMKVASQHCRSGGGVVILVVALQEENRLRSVDAQ